MDVITAITCIDKVPLFASLSIVWIDNHGIILIKTPVFIIKIEVCAAISNFQNSVVTEVASDTFLHGVYLPHLTACTCSCSYSDATSPLSVGIGLNDGTCGGIHNLEVAHSGERLHVLAALDVDDALRIFLCLGLIIAIGVGRHVHVESACGSISIVIYIAVLADETITGFRGLALTAADVGFRHTVLRVAVDAGCGKGTCVFVIGKTIARTVIGTAELGAGMLRCAPPDAVIHAVISTHHGLHHIVHLVLAEQLAVVLHLLHEADEVGGSSSQLVLVAFVNVGLVIVVESACVVGIQHVAS